MARAVSIGGQREVPSPGCHIVGNSSFGGEVGAVIAPLVVRRAVRASASFTRHDSPEVTATVA